MHQAVMDVIVETEHQIATLPKASELVAAHTMHGAIDSNNDGLVVGFKQAIEGGGNTPQPVEIISDNDGVRVLTAQDTAIVNGKKYQLEKQGSLPCLSDKWSIALLLSFLSASETPGEIFKNIKNAIMRYVDLLNEGHPGLLAAWVIASYFAHMFQAFPFLHLYGPKEAGKSRLLEILSLLSFNATKVKDISIPALGDIVDGMRGTLLLDQAETMSRQMIGILADSYKKLGAVRKITRLSGNNRSVLEFSAYGPKAFASTAELDPDLADRCSRIAMQRTKRSMPDFMGYEPEWLELRDQLYRFLLTRWRDIRREYLATQSNGTRRGELWRPLEAVLKVCNVPEEEIAVIKSAFDESTAQTRSTMTVQEIAIFQVLRDEAERHDAFSISSKELVTQLKPLLNKEDLISHQAAGKLIKKYNLATEYVKKSRKKQLYYGFTRGVILDAISRYSIEEMLAPIASKKTGGEEVEV